jgi:hypothetical protein
VTPPPLRQASDSSFNLMALLINYSATICDEHIFGAASVFVILSDYLNDNALRKMDIFLSFLFFFLFFPEERMFFLRL